MNPFAVIALIILASLGGLALGDTLGRDSTMKRLQSEAVREKAATWVTNQIGMPEFKWKACVWKEERK